MPSLRLTPGRIAWIVLLGLLFAFAPRPRRHSPEPRFEPPPSRSLSGAGRQFVGLVTGEEIPKAREMGLDEDLFASDTLVRIDIKIPDSGLNILRRYHWQMGNDARQDASATVYEGQKVYSKVAVHLKGSAGSFQSVDGAPSLTLNFDKVVRGQTFHGLKKIHLNASHQDSSLVSEQLCRELFNAAGVPTPRATQARVSLNGRDLGVYVLVEGANKQFLKRHFKDADGVLYDGGFVSDVHAGLEVDSGDEHLGREHLGSFLAAMQPAKPDKRARIESVLDVDRFLSMVALEVLTVHWDGYSMNKNNYRIYRDSESQRFVFLPHGMDQMFGYRRSSPTLDINAGMNGSVTRQVLSVPEFKARYVQRVGEVFTNSFNAEVLLGRVDAISARMKPFLAESGIFAIRGQMEAANGLRQRIIARVNHVQSQLANGPKPLRFNQANEVHLSKWSPGRVSGSVRFPRTDGPNGERIGVALSGAGAGSWRTQAVLEPGRYRFIGKASALGLLIDPKLPDPIDNEGRTLFSGVGLRISGGEMQQRLTHDAAGEEVWCDFEVSVLSEVVLICECKASAGEGYFDVSSLRLIRR